MHEGGGAERSAAKRALSASRWEDGHNLVSLNTPYATLVSPSITKYMGRTSPGAWKQPIAIVGSGASHLGGWAKVPFSLGLKTVYVYYATIDFWVKANIRNQIHLSPAICGRKPFILRARHVWQHASSPHARAESASASSSLTDRLTSGPKIFYVVSNWEVEKDGSNKWEAIWCDLSISISSKFCKLQFVQMLGAQKRELCRTINSRARFLRRLSNVFYVKVLWGWLAQFRKQ